jgi:uncharacterized repeat protein (TIGR03803 family)
LGVERLETRLTPSYNLTDLASFNGTNGSAPETALVEDNSGNFFGTTAYGGQYGEGTVFEWVKSTGTISVLASFDNVNGANPSGGLVEDISGNLFGTTSAAASDYGGELFEWVKSSGKIVDLVNLNSTTGYSDVGNTGVIADSSGNLFGITSSGGTSDGGTLFEWVKSSGTFSVLANLNFSTGDNSAGGLIEDSSGNLFGTSIEGGAGGGTVFEWVKSTGTIAVLARFTGASGYDAFGSLVADTSGDLYGATGMGGANGDGTVFEWVKSSGTLSVLANFDATTGYTPFQYFPFAGLAADSSGNLFGTAYLGGSSGDGTVYELAKGSGTISVLANFNGSDGDRPFGSLLVDGYGDVFGTTGAGGANDGGTLFELGDTAPPAFTSPSNAHFTEGRFSSFTVTASGTPSPTLSESGPLPAGITFNDSTGVLSGTPTVGGTYDVTFNATNAFGSLTQAFTLTVSPADIVVSSVTTNDSRSVIVTYQINDPTFASDSLPLQIGIYRSDVPTYSASDLLTTELTSITIPDTDNNFTLGSHTVTLAAQLPPIPAQPYVLAVADPSNALTNESIDNSNGHFRIYTIGAVTHGWDPSPSDPTWVTDMTTALTEQGYDAVIPFFWSSFEPLSGLTVSAGNTLYRQILTAAANLVGVQPNDVIDVHLIGHSRGADVIDQAALDLVSLSPTPNGNTTPLSRGYYKLTFLDPHPATNALGLDSSFLLPTNLPTLEAFLASAAFVYSGDATYSDPLITVPARINQVEDFYEQTLTSSLSSGDASYESAVNFWGLPPSLLGIADDTQTIVNSYNLTGLGLGHVEVHDWYQTNVVPLLGYGTAIPPLTPVTPPPPGVPAQLFLLTPLTGQVYTNTPFTVGVLAVDDQGIPTLFNGAVTLSLQAGSADTALGGTVTAQAIDGVVTFNNLTLSQVGSDTIIASSDGLTSGTSLPISVVAVTSPQPNDPEILPGLTDGEPADENIIEYADPTDVAFSLSSGTLPPGLTLDSSTGTLSGTPTAGGDYSFAIAITDDDGEVLDDSYTENVNLPVLTVTANDATRVFGAADPSFTYSITGFINGDNSSVVEGTPALTTNATQHSSVGAYAITAALGTLSAANYAFSFDPGDLIITQATPKVVVADAGGMVDGSPFPASAAVEGVDGAVVSNLESVAPTLLYYDGSAGDGIGSPTPPSAVGTYTVVATFPGSTDYTAASNSVTFAIIPSSTSTTVASILVPASMASENVVLRATVTNTAGPVNGGTVAFNVLQSNSPLGVAVSSASVVGGSATAAYTLPANTPPGTYTVHATYSGNGLFPGGLPGTNTFTVDGAPSLPAIDGDNTITEQHDLMDTLSVPLGATSPLGNSLTYTATVLGDSALFDLEQQYQFRGIGYYSAGATAYVLQANGNNSFGNPYYLLRPADGALFAYDGSGGYAHSFTGTALATPGVNVYTDPTLLLNAQPPVDYPTVYNVEQQYHFLEVGSGYYTAGAAAFVLQASINNSFGNSYYLLSPAGGLYAYDGSGSYAHTFANVTPAAMLDPEIYSHPAELLDAQAAPTLYSQLEQLQQQYDLQEYNGSFYTNTYGNQAEWFYSPVLNQYGEHWYTLTPDGTLRAWEGYSDSATGATIASLATSVYSNPTWLTNATALPAPSEVTASVDSSGNLTIDSTNYIGTFRVQVNATDGFLSSSQIALVNSTGVAPTIVVQDSKSNTIPAGSDQSIPHLDFPQQYNVELTGQPQDTGFSSSVTFSSFSLPFSLEQQYRFQGLGTITAGATAYVLQANGNNSFGNPYYLLSSAGGLYAYDGSGSYAHTFANVTPTANLAANFYADPSLLLNAQPPIDYSQLHSLQQQYQFTGLGFLSAGATAYVLQANANSSYGNPYYLLSPAGGLYAYDGSGSYAHTFANVTPLATLDPGVYVNPALLTSALASPQLYPQLLAVEQQYDLKGLGYYVAGAPAYVLTAPTNNANGNPYYLLNASGNLYAYDSSGSYSHTFANSANLVEALDPSVYSNPTLLTSAKAPLADTGVTVGLVSFDLDLSAPASYVGTFEVTIHAAIANSTSTQSILFTSTDTAPLPNAIPAQTVSLSNPTVTLTLGATDADNDPVTYTSVAKGYSLEYTLQQEYGFRGVGRVTTPDGATAYVLAANGSNANGNPYYLLTSTGGLYAYDGSGSFSHTIANSGNFVAQLSANDYTTPTLLTNARPPVTTPAIQSALSAPVGNQLTLNVTGLSVGTVFEVFVTVSDGAETSETSFLVTVTG